MKAILPGMESKYMKATFHTVTPLIPAGESLAAALAFYTAQMGFRVLWQAGTMAGIERDGVTFNLVQNNNRAWAENASFSVGVSDLEMMYSEYRGLPAVVGPLEMKSWGRREFHLLVSPGVAFQFYQRDAA